jgi:hypothetical protein
MKKKNVRRDKPVHHFDVKEILKKEDDRKNRKRKEKKERDD